MSLSKGLASRSRRLDTSVQHKENNERQHYVFFKDLLCMVTCERRSGFSED
jgi:hypothetical protein